MKRIIAGCLMVLVSGAHAANNPSDEAAAWDALLMKFGQPINSQQSYLADLNSEASRLGFQISKGQLADILTNNFKSGDSTMQKSIIAHVVGLTLVSSSAVAGVVNGLDGNAYQLPDGWSVSHGSDNTCKALDQCVLAVQHDHDQFNSNGPLVYYMTKDGKAWDYMAWTEHTPKTIVPNTMGEHLHDFTPNTTVNVIGSTMYPTASKPYYVDFDAINKGVQFKNEQITRATADRFLTDRVRKDEEFAAQLRTDVDNANSGAASANFGLGELDKRVSVLEQTPQQSVTQYDDTAIQSRISALENKPQQSGGITTLDGQDASNANVTYTAADGVTQQTNTLSMIANEVDSNNAAINSHTATLADHESRITTNEGNIANNSVRLDQHEMRMTADESRITTNESRLDDHDVRISKNTTDIASNKSTNDAQDKQLANHETRISNVEGEQQVIKQDQQTLMDNQDVMASDLQDHENRIEYLEHNGSVDVAAHERLNKVEQHDKQQDKTIADNHKKAMAGVSSAMAMTGLHYTSDANSMALGAGSYGGSSAVAMGYQHNFGHAQVSTQVSYDQTGNAGVSGSIAFGW